MWHEQPSSKGVVNLFMICVISHGHISKDSDKYLTCHFHSMMIHDDVLITCQFKFWYMYEFRPDYRFAC